ncbi:MAG: hypothetical protein ACJ8DI_18540 [Ktedonobacteraceae bacterium]
MKSVPLDHQNNPKFTGQASSLQHYRSDDGRGVLDSLLSLKTYLEDEAEGV